MNKIQYVWFSQYNDEEKVFRGQDGSIKYEYFDEKILYRYFPDPRVPVQGKFDKDVCYGFGTNKYGNYYVLCKDSWWKDGTEMLIVFVGKNVSTDGKIVKEFLDTINKYSYDGIIAPDPEEYKDKKGYYGILKWEEEIYAKEYASSSTQAMREGIKKKISDLQHKLENTLLEDKEAVADYGTKYKYVSYTKDEQLTDTLLKYPKQEEYRQAEIVIFVDEKNIKSTNFSVEKIEFYNIKPYNYLVVAEDLKNKYSKIQIGSQSQCPLKIIDNKQSYTIEFIKFNGYKARIELNYKEICKLCKGDGLELTMIEEPNGLKFKREFVLKFFENGKEIKKIKCNINGRKCVYATEKKVVLEENKSVQITDISSGKTSYENINDLQISKNDTNEIQVKISRKQKEGGVKMNIWKVGFICLVVVVVLVLVVIIFKPFNKGDDPIPKTETSTETLTEEQKTVKEITSDSVYLKHKDEWSINDLQSEDAKDIVKRASNGDVTYFLNTQPRPYERAVTNDSARNGYYNKIIYNANEIGKDKFAEILRKYSKDSIFNVKGCWEEMSKYIKGTNGTKYGNYSTNTGQEPTKKQVQSQKVNTHKKENQASSKPSSNDKNNKKTKEIQ